MNSTNGIMMSVYWIFVVSHIQTNPSIFIPESTLVLPEQSWSERKGSLFVGPYPRSDTLIEAVASSAVLLSRHSRLSRWVLYTKYNFCLPSFFV